MNPGAAGRGGEEKRVEVNQSLTFLFTVVGSAAAAALLSQMIQFCIMSGEAVMLTACLGTWRSLHLVEIPIGSATPQVF